jgi:hypothetical protein
MGSRPSTFGDIRHIFDARRSSRITSHSVLEAGSRMNALKVLTALVEIERIVGKCDPMAIRPLILEAEEGVLRLEQELMAALETNGSLREQLEIGDQFSLLRPPTAGERWPN